MINYNKLAIFKALADKGCRAFANKSNYIFYDRRETTAFMRYLSAPKPVKKYYLTETTMRRVNGLDLSSIHFKDLSMLYDKYGRDVGIIFCENEKLNFLYVIDANQIILICCKGYDVKKRFVDWSSKDNDDRYLQYQLSEVFLGGVVLPFEEDSPIYCGNNLISAIETKNGNRVVQCNSIYANDMRLAYSKIPQGEKDTDTYEEAMKVIYDKHLPTYTRQKELLSKCLQMFIFVKTAKVVDMTFITDSGLHKEYNHDSIKLNGIIKVDSFYDSNINVMPFAVRGHFRNQPKKNDEGEWYRELIYIDGFMKSGYHRKATKLKIEERESNE